MVAIRVANRVAIRVSIRNPESQPKGSKIHNPGGFLWLRSGLRTGFQLQFRNLKHSGTSQGCESNRNPDQNPETYRFQFFLKIATLAVFYGFDYGFGFDRNLLKVFPVTEYDLHTLGAICVLDSILHTLFAYANSIFRTESRTQRNLRTLNAARLASSTQTFLNSKPG